MFEFCIRARSPSLNSSLAFQECVFWRGVILFAGYAAYGVPGYANTSNNIGDEPGEMPPADVRMISSERERDSLLVVCTDTMSLTQSTALFQPLEPSTSPTSLVEAGHVCALTSTGEVYCWGGV